MSRRIVTNQNKFVPAHVQYQIPILFKVYNEFSNKAFPFGTNRKIVFNPCSLLTFFPPGQWTFVLLYSSFQIATAIDPSAHYVCCKRLSGICHRKLFHFRPRLAIGFQVNFESGHSQILKTGNYYQNLYF